MPPELHPVFSLCYTDPGSRLQSLGERWLDKLARVHAGVHPEGCRDHGNLWVLGGEIIRDLNETPSLRKRPIEDLVFDGIEDGGLLPYHHDSEEELRSFESTCRRYRRFLEQQRG
jgi:hypothetical protein